MFRRGNSMVNPAQQIIIIINAYKLNRVNPDQIGIAISLKRSRMAENTFENMHVVVVLNFPQMFSTFNIEASLHNDRLSTSIFVNMIMPKEGVEESR
jgi:hypothetical protein